ncbi:MAG: hypothetical protein COU47_04395 [Candidatus Niyogibacteria bacterium CG10_big_fil_rev_8_21_14_0_10_46_36]|uniref:Uncharacterized protein n=1 Tax=Candidatus Niyogibacteria bacterium CG10_big_fil_rev_8_21_14_0_10_46_36 TaxID=1974726 RepID=A0A2H0TCN0_9BACT|nr:MAG: hypothetical protein COU47_04395 [Candidatus Niyogibacteria bacterium CG10_big_fil_rev_8_21_14_0_10_46_36]
MYIYEKRCRYRSDFSTHDNHKRYKHAVRVTFVSVGLIVLMFSVFAFFAKEITLPVLFVGVALAFGLFFYSRWREQVYIKRFCFICKKDFSFNEEVVEKICSGFFPQTLRAHHGACVEEEEIKIGGTI